MPFETYWETQGVYQKYYGQLSVEDREQALHELMGSPQFDSIKYKIVDSLEIKEYQLKKTHAEVAAANDIGGAYTNSNILLAFVTTNPDHLDNIKHYKETLTSDFTWKVRVFDDVESARKWISETLKS